MSLDTALGTALGAVLSLALFAFSYRQTVGARRERVRSANGEMERVLIKRFVQDSGHPSLKDLERYIEGKAREHQVSPSGLLSAEELLTNVYAHIFEDDLLDTPRRDTAGDRIKALLDQLDREPEDLWPSAADGEMLADRRRRLIAVMAATTAMVGSLAALLPAIGGQDGQVRAVSYLAALGTSLGVIGAVIAVFRLRYEDDPDQARDSSIQRAAHLERSVERVVKRYGGERLDGPDRGLDFLVERQGRRLGIELKAWNRPLARPFVDRALERAALAGKHLGVDEVLFVTPSRPPSSAREADDGLVRWIAVDELAAALKHSAR
jgi:hypothetical protein